MKINSLVLGLLVVVLIFGGIGISSLTGDWQTTSTKNPVKFTQGTFTGQSNPADIRGSYSFADISRTFEIPLSDLAVAFGIESNAAAFQVKSLESLYFNPLNGTSVGTNSVRLFVAYYKGLPFATSDSVYLLPAAVSLLKTKAKLTTEQITFLDTHTYQPAASN
jgi:hypothetical protein